MSAQDGPALRAYLLAMRLAAPIAPFLLRRRLARGKEDPQRMGEKLGRATLARPPGRLVWLHAVGLGEVMALRGLIEAMAQVAPDLSFLVTSTARSSARVFGANLPPRTQHQFLPIDAPRYTRPFLDHWRPALSVWSEQDLWPGIVRETALRGVPLALVNVRLNDRAGGARGRARGIYRDSYRRFALIGAQDETSARALQALGAPGPVPLHASLKIGAPALGCDGAVLEALRRAFAGRTLWCVGSSHAEDETVALAAHAARLARDPAGCLIIAPRLVDRGASIAAAARAAGFAVAARSTGAGPEGAAVYVADTFGEMGLWYRLAPAVLMGGSFGPVEGHNPWEPARLGAAVLHGPRTANFAGDYARLDAAGAARMVADADALAAALADPATAAMPPRAEALIAAGAGEIAALARRIVALVPARGGAA
ncbi:MAG: 3-deoxy-D-manno-octulosonic acid transferase [Defluviimonas sp.]|uniref:3-deoxy-D-manno-octulosonic acid transferase n=1 Tax=Albidovulum sp. TaxID=1872424 RepID=UPI001D420095|nr:3-deoxy-D-manno-octulosonic acid transferase [Paracoccaceae bacterium]MCC0063643.1 3-deoxy-D-manno-octulosonic acid transferase [Defluviimonas sp.]